LEEEEDGPHPFDQDAENNNMHNSNDETYRSPNESNEEFGGNTRNMYDIQLDEENNGCSTNVLLIARFIDGTGFMNSKNDLLEKEDAYVEIAKTIGTTVSSNKSGQMDEVI